MLLKERLPIDSMVSMSFSYMVRKVNLPFEKLDCCGCSIKPLDVAFLAYKMCVFFEFGTKSVV